MDGSLSGPDSWPRVRRVLRAIDGLTKLDGWLGVVCLVMLTGLVVANIAVRSLSNFVPGLPPELPMSWELGSYLMAGTFTFGAAMALRAGNHVRVQLLLRRLSSDRRRALEVAASLVALVFVAFLSWALVNLTLTSYRLGEKSLAGGISLWMPQSVITFAFGLLCLQLLARAIRAVLQLPLEERPFDSEDGISRK